jgi:hypothetical protein
MGGGVLIGVRKTGLQLLMVRVECGIGDDKITCIAYVY